MTDLRRAARAWRSLRQFSCPISRRRLAAGVASLAGLAGFTGAPTPTSANGTATATATTATRPGPKPNIILVVCDDLAVSLYDRIAPLRRDLESSGLRFDNAISPVPSCAPARASLLSGRYPQNHGVLINTPPDGGVQAFIRNGGELSSLGLRMQFAGYRTALVGKYLNEYETATPTRLPAGWDVWHAWAGGGKYTEYVVNDGGALATRNVANSPGDYETDWYSSVANQFVASAQGKPFFLYLAPHAPHLPAIPAARHASLGAEVTGPATAAIDEPDVSDKPRWVRRLPRISGGGRRRSDLRFREQYQTMLAVADLVRSLLASLQTSGQLDNTWLFFTSDNGFFYGEHRIPSGKGALYDEGIRVPLIVRGPGVRRGTSNLLVSGVDLLPTILDLARSPYAGIDGRSFAAALTGPEPRAWRGACFARFGLEPRRSAPRSSRSSPAATPAPRDADGPDDIDGGGGAFALRGADWSCIRTLRTGEEEFYDLGEDPAQLANLWPSLPEPARATLRAALDALSTCRSDNCRTIENRIPATAAAIRALTG